jgi:hypothetical protein
VHCRLHLSAGRGTVPAVRFDPVVRADPAVRCSLAVHWGSAVQAGPVVHTDPAGHADIAPGVVLGGCEPVAPTPWVRPH